jgi:hypothetical protein
MPSAIIPEEERVIFPPTIFEKDTIKMESFARAKMFDTELG